MSEGASRDYLLHQHRDATQRVQTSDGRAVTLCAFSDAFMSLTSAVVQPE